MAFMHQGTETGQPVKMLIEELIHFIEFRLLKSCGETVERSACVKSSRYREMARITIFKDQ